MKEICREGRVAELKEFVENPHKNFSVTEDLTGYYETPLHIASFYGNYEVLRYLIELVQNNPNQFHIFNMQNKWGDTPLFLAIWSG